MNNAYRVRYRTCWVGEVTWIRHVGSVNYSIIEPGVFPACQFLSPAKQDVSGGSSFHRGAVLIRRRDVRSWIITRKRNHWTPQGFLSAVIFSVSELLRPRTSLR